MAFEDALTKANAKIAFVRHKNNMLQKKLEMYNFVYKINKKMLCKVKLHFLILKLIVWKWRMFWQRPIER
jgi:hypothetical protein